MADDSPRLLVIPGPTVDPEQIRPTLEGGYTLDIVDDADKAVEALRREDYAAVLADAAAFPRLPRGLAADKAAMALNTIGEGVIIVEADGRGTWTNPRMRSFAPEVVEHVKRVGVQALQVFATGSGPITDMSQTRSKKFTFQVSERYFEMICSPVVDGNGLIKQIVAVVWDATSGKRLQSKIDAIDASGRELARITSDSVSDLNPKERLKLLQDKIIRYSKDLMHFDHFAIRLLNKKTKRLDVVISEGLPLEALEIDLYGEPEGNGISGYVAATGRSYLCHDCEKDPRYVLGLRHCKSSLTVPLMLYDEVVGVYNVESETVGAFNEDDRQFAEIFGRYVGLALNILDLLVVERYTTSGKITSSVVEEMDQPLGEIVTEAQTLLEEYIGDDNMRGKLQHIIDKVEQVRSSVKDVAAGPNAVLGAGKAGQGDEAEASGLKGMRVLIADDEPNIRQTLAKVLGALGCVVEVCKDGYEACAELERADYDLVISDIKMPYRNGYEIFAAAQRCQEGTPVLLMTGFGYDPHHSIVRASQEGLSAVLFKPFKVEQLLEEVRKALGLDATAAEPADEPAST
ncbi:MAG: response regulator [Planctomycetota bacterium]